MAGSPIQYLRRTVVTQKEMPQDYELTFDYLMLKKEKNFVEVDLKREQGNYKRRLKRMEKLEEKLKREREVEEDQR